MMQQVKHPEGGGYLVPSYLITGQWVDRSGPIRRVLARLGLARRTMVWQPPIFPQEDRR